MRLSSNTHYLIIKPSRVPVQLSYAFTSVPSVARVLRRREEAPAIAACSKLISVIRYAKTRRLLSAGKMAHGFILRAGMESQVYIINNLLCLYLWSGVIFYARKVFETMLARDSVSWNTMISGYVSLGIYRDGFSLFREMIRLGALPTHPSFVSILVACPELGILIYTRQVHSLIIRFGFFDFPFVGNSLLKSYVELGEYEDWRKTLKDMPTFDEISIEILLRGYACHKSFGFAAELFKHSRSIGLLVTPYTITSLVSLCSSHYQANFGVQIHGFSEKVGLIMDVSIVNSLITMYSRTMALQDAEDLFEWFSLRDSVSWNSLISGYAYNGEGDAGIALVQRFLSNGILLNESTFLSFLSCCATIGALRNAKKAHALILKLREGFDDEWTDNAILTMYCRTKSIYDAAASFQASKVKDALSVNLIMGLYRICGHHEESISLFHMVHSLGSQMDEMMYSGVLSSSSRLEILDFGCQIHGCVIKAGFDKLSRLKNSILELYSQCGRIDDMERVFEESETVDLFSWNTMLSGYADIDLFHRAICIWQKMLDFEVKLNEFSYSALLHACCHADVLLIGERIHSIIYKMGLLFDITLLNSLLTMYSNCRQMERAQMIFQEIPLPNSVSWNAMISGYTQNGFPNKSIVFYTKMNESGIETNEMTYASLLSSCSFLSNLKIGLQLHALTVKKAFDLYLIVSNSLITMYARCGDIHESSRIFYRTQYPDLVTWNSMINAYAHHGLAKEAISVFQQMNDSYEKPNNVTFLGIISSCSSAGLVLEAFNYFNIMDEIYGIAPTEELCACLVDALCRAGKLRDAKLFIESMSIRNCSLVWRTLLSFCRLNGDIKLGEVSAEKIVDLEPLDSAPYVNLSDLYAFLGNITMKNHIRRLMENRGVKKITGRSWISG